ncbi:ABC transporter permease [Paenibacillus sp. FSL M8-0334]|uniref:ABC transporter permease n=1 Tax=Paenibacillus sp. FSL M8-0334 TaxID=2921623 RepID=UPI0030FAAC5C
MTTNKRIASPNAIFRRRLVSHWSYQRSNIGAVVDWVIMLYILIPGLLLGIRLYRDFLTRPLPAWIELIPFQGAAAVLLLLFSGRLLLFMEEADVLFLRQHPAWMKGLMIRGIIYSQLVSTLRGMLLTALILPVLMAAYGLSIGTLISLLALAAVCSWCTNVAFRMIAVSYKGWRHRLWAGITRIVSLWGYILVATWGSDRPGLMWGAIAILVPVLLLLVRMRVRLRATFLTDVREDAKVRVQLTEKLLTQAVGKPPSIRSKPWLFRKSGRLYSRGADKRLASAGIKALLRNPESLLMYIQITALGIPAIWLPPPIIKLIVLAALLLMMSYWLNTSWARFAKSDFVAVLPFSNDQFRSAGKLAAGTLLAIPAAVYGVTAGMTMFSPLLGLLAGLVLAALSVWVVPSLTAWPLYKEERGIQSVNKRAAEAND